MVGRPLGSATVGIKLVRANLTKRNRYGHRSVEASGGLGGSFPAARTPGWSKIHFQTYGFSVVVLYILLHCLSRGKLRSFIGGTRRLPSHQKERLRI